MVIEPTNMFNYQIVNNNTNVIGVIHSYSEEIINKDLLKLVLNLKRVNSNNSYIVNATVVEV